MKSVLLSLDPSTTCTGIALWRGKKLVDVCKVRATSAKIAPVERAMKLALSCKDVCTEMIERIDKNPAKIRLSIVVEVPGGQSRPHSRGLVTLGFGVGATCMMLSNFGLVHPQFEFDMVPVSTWSRLRGKRCMSKVDRAELIRAKFDEVDWTQDKGHDIADAVGLGAWHLGLLK